MEELMTIREAAQFLKVSEPMIYRLMQQDELHPIRRGRRYTRFLKADLEAFVEKHRTDRSSYADQA